MNKLLSTVGIVLTLLYLGFVASIFCARIPEILSLAPNNFGDFMAGVFGPLAILWLILGFFQQGIELRQNTNALELQASELANSVAQQKELVEVTRTQVAAELQVIAYEREKQKELLKAKFIFSPLTCVGTNGGYIYTSNVRNVGNTALEVNFKFSEPISTCSLEYVPSWSRGEEKLCKWFSSEVLNLYSLELSISIFYINYSGESSELNFKLAEVKRQKLNFVEYS